MAAPSHSQTDDRYRLLIFPRRNRWPKRWHDWFRLTMTIVILAGLPPVVSWVAPRINCRPGALPSPDVWRQKGECVGVSGGSYAFGQAEFQAVLRKIADQNGAARDGSCVKNSKAVTVGVLMTLTSVDAGGRAVHQLEGIAAAQARANKDKAGCIHPIRLRVGQMGATQQAATAVADLLSDDVIAVVGLGLSYQKTADAAELLAERRIPMVGAVITAEGFDKNGSADDRPDFRGCDPKGTYKNGVGQGFFYRVAYRNAVQINRLGEYYTEARRDKLNFILTPITIDDPYTCTTLPLLHHRFGDVQEVRFDPADPATVSQSAKRICASDGAVNVFYAARARDLPRFLKRISDESANGQCQFSTITVMSTSDAARIRAQETDPNVEQQREAVLNAPTFRNGTVRLVYTPLADPDVLAGSRRPGFLQLRQAFADTGFNVAHLDDGWAINGYDSLSTVATALNTLSAGQKVTPTQVNTAISGFSKGGGVIPGADGNITFDNNGNRDDSAPVVVQLCPPKTAGQEARTVQIHPAAGKCP